jgi:DNA-3-methyladenine glycosylase
MPKSTATTWPIEVAHALPRAFYARDPVAVGLDLLGARLVHRRAGMLKVGRIVEVEAYLGPHDLASHSSRGLTARTRVMFGPAGHAYVYLIYGRHCCMNVVTGSGNGSAVLLRALEPLEGVSGRTSGPGLLCRQMGIDRDLNGHDLTDGVGLHLVKRPSGETFRVTRSARIGIQYAGRWSRRRLRFYIYGNPFVSIP